VTPRSLALVLGIVYLGLGVLGLMPGALAGLPVSPALALVHLAMGAWGLAAYAGRARAQTYARSAAFIFVALGLAGMLDGIERFLMGPTYGSISPARGSPDPSAGGHAPASVGASAATGAAPGRFG
jgi:hypothetical protein